MAIAFIYWNETHTAMALVWLSIVVLATATRILLYRRFRLAGRQHSVSYWLARHASTACLVGIAWGVAPLLASSTTSANLHELGMLIPGFIIMGSITSYGIFFSQYGIFISAVALAAISTRLAVDGPVALSEIALFVLFLPVAVLTAWRLSRSLLGSLNAQETLSLELIRRRLHFNQSRDGVVIVRLDGRVEEASTSFATMLGYPYDQALQLNVWDWDPEWPEERWNREVRDQKQKPPGVFETVWRRQDGVTFPVEISHNPVEIGGKNLWYCVCRDVSERKLAEAALRDKEAMLQAMSSMAQIGGWQFDVTTGTGSWTEETARIHDLPVTAAATVALGLSVYVGDSQIKIARALRAAIERAEPYDLELEMITPAGKRKWVRTMGSPLIEQGQVVKLRGALQDISLQKQMVLAQRERYELEKRLARLSESVPGLICALRLQADGNLSMPIASTAIVDVFGVTQEAVQENLELLYRNMPENQAQDLLGSLSDSSKNLSLWWMDFRYCHPQKGERWFEGRAFPQRESDGSTLWHAFVMDITERKHAEAERQQALQALRDSEEHHRAVVDSALDAVVSMDTAGLIIGWNTQAERIFGWSREQALGRTLGDTIVPAHLRCAHQQGLMHYLRFGTGVVLNQRIETTALRQDGSEFPTELAITPIQSRGERMFTAFLRDITDRKQAEAEITRHRDHLQELVAERTRDLSLAKEAAEQANQAKSEFLANMSHELRTPMHAILSFARRGRDKVEQYEVEKLRRYFGNIVTSGTRLMYLLNDLLDLSKLESGHQQWYIDLHDLYATVGSVSTELRSLAADRGINLNVTTITTNTYLHYDDSRIAQVLRNIIGNAIKFSQAGGTVTITLADAVLAVAQNVGEAVVPAILLQVRDEGLGIPDAELKAIFDKFFQSSKTRTGAGGTGLGLAISKEIVLAHGGTIDVVNNAERGVTVSVSLPRHPIGLLVNPEALDESIAHFSS